MENALDGVRQIPRIAGGHVPRKNNLHKFTADATTREDVEFKSDSGYAANLESATSANIFTAGVPTREDGMNMDGISTACHHFKPENRKHG